ncbi:3-methyl-2-oxobutanoate hydroxymethyltransferase [Jatrophihabitans telluris]|uniref:3-methyl-2-oxobutanoate hydroxymethyltransferase n=1 Tax=Jatrophihabitans telluris TaxID=2038343 RepID=A0ABY4QZE9_9ACTN|nr:3-methyl-2-oxobutanoate hydroxymethyltransferase [Jatrophihabitans telluris]UQX88969.1 3-methyl-2-oxobutanoate hydroxymethyltransferase [Jatrophihabitans telluris]
MSNASYVGDSTRRVTTKDLQEAKRSHHRWAMLTAYDYSTARVFDQAGIPVLLVGDSAANVVYGYDTTVPISIDELLPLVGGVARGAERALVVADLPFGAYEASAEQALASATRFMQRGAQAVKVEGGERISAQVKALTSSGIPVMGHLGVTPQAVNSLSGYRVQGRGDEEAEQMLRDARALEAAGAFAVVLEVVPAALAATITKELGIPTIGIGAGVECDAQVLVWQDMAGLRGGGRPARFVKEYADLNAVLGAAVEAFATEVRAGTYPSSEHSYR